MHAHQYYAIGLFLILFINCFSFISIAYTDTKITFCNDLNSNDNINSFVVELEDEPLLKYRIKIRESINNFVVKLTQKAEESFLRTKVREYKERLISLQKKVKDNILDILGINDINIFSNDFFELFNGFSVKNITNSEINEIKDLPFIKGIYPNSNISIQLDNSVPLIKANEVWKLHDKFNENITGKGIKIAFLDTGVNYLHPDLVDNFIAQGSYDFVNNDSDPMDDNGHGTHVAGIACGTGKLSNFQYRGVSPDAKYYSFKILDKTGNGNLETFIAGMQRALDPNEDGDTNDRVDIISLSIGTQTPGNPTDKFCEIVDEMVSAGIVVVIAAGNSGPLSKTITSPGCSLKGICVGSVNNNDEIAHSSSRGPVVYNNEFITKPDIVAPGVLIYSCNWKGGYRYCQGTSMATPHVAGAAALLLQANPEYNPEDVKRILKHNAKNLNIDENTQGAGRLDILNPFLDDNIIYTSIPNEIKEGEILKIALSDKNNNPVNAWILVAIPFHFPRLKYGSDVQIIIPYIFSRRIDVLTGRIYIFNLFGNYKMIKRVIKVINN